MANSLLYAWGNSQDGQLGVGTTDSVAQPQVVEGQTQKRFVSVAVGTTHTLVIDSEGLVHSFGNNDYGQLGHNKRRLRPEVIDTLEVFRVKQVACGSGHSLALTEDGQVLAWGQNDRGQLGIGLEAVGHDSPKPKFIKALATDRIVQVACGAKHCLALSEDGKVWAWGENSSGQLGNGTFVFAHTPFVITALHGRPIRKIACGSAHSVVLSVSGRVYSWGENSFGQLGTGDTTKLLRPQIIKSASAYGVADVSCGENHTAFVSRVGKVFTFGAGSSGQLGHQGTNRELSPKAVPDLEQEPGTLVACGRRHTLVYQPKSRRFFSFGLNASGQLGQAIGGGKGTSSPFAVKSLDGVGVEEMVCGGDQSFAVISQPISPSSQDNGVTSSADTEMTQAVTEQPPPIPQNSILFINRAILQAYLTKAASTSNYAPLQHLVEVVFPSISCVNASFLSPDHFDTSDAKSGIDYSDMQDCFKMLLSCPDKNIINTLGNAFSKLADSLFHYQTGLPECMRVFIVLLFNPLLLDPSVYHIVCQKVVSLFVGLPDKMRDALSGWLTRMMPSEFSTILAVYQKFLSFLVDKKNQLTLDASIISINNKGHILPQRFFYNPEVVQNIDLQADYLTWVTEKNQFSFCQFPFLLDLPTKSIILHIDARRQMTNEITHFIHQALTNTLMPVINQRQPQQQQQQQIRVDANPFILLKVRRQSLLQDCLTQLAKYSIRDFKRPLIVQFEGEEGQDEGGLRKEFFGLVAQALVNSETPLFKSEESNLLWFASNPKEPDSTYRLIGILLGIAIYNGCLIDLPFPVVLYKKLLSHDLTLDDLAELKPTVARNLQQLLDADVEDFESTFGLVFQVQEERAGQIVTVDLKPGGGDLRVTRHNRHEYVDLYVKHVLTDSVTREFSAFSDGFSYICSGPLYDLFQPAELEVLVRGNPNYNFFDLEKAAIYDGYDKDHPVIKNFWKIFHSMPTTLKRRFLIFLTGTDRVPVSGLANMRFVIQQVKDTTRLPAAHTCFNILDLPCYETIGELQEKLVFAITNTEGFGLV